LESEECKIKKNDIIIYQHLYGLHMMNEKVGLIIHVFFNFWIGRKEFLILTNNKLARINQDMITYRKINTDD